MLVRMWRKGNPCILLGNVNWCNHYGKQFGDFSRNKKTELSYDTAIPFQGIYQNKKKKENTYLKRYMLSNIHSTVFIITMVWKQPKCLSTDEWIKKV